MNKRESIQISKEINYNASPSLPKKNYLILTSTGYIYYGPKIYSIFLSSFSSVAIYNSFYRFSKHSVNS